VGVRSAGSFARLFENPASSPPVQPRRRTGSWPGLGSPSLRAFVTHESSGSADECYIATSPYSGPSTELRHLSSACLQRLHRLGSLLEATAREQPTSAHIRSASRAARYNQLAPESSGGDKHAGPQIRHTSFPSHHKGRSRSCSPPTASPPLWDPWPAEVAGNPPGPSNSMWPCRGLQMCSSGGPCNWPLMHPLPCFSGTLALTNPAAASVVVRPLVCLELTDFELSLGLRSGPNRPTCQHASARGSGAPGDVLSGSACRCRQAADGPCCGSLLIGPSLCQT
jgi:hypothetical protein